MEEKRAPKYKFLIHCRIPQMREGFEEKLQSLSVLYKVYYTNLEEEGILAKLRYCPQLIIVLLHEGDSDFNLPLKIKLFAPSLPLLVILPEVPATYRTYLERAGVDAIIELPDEDNLIGGTILQLIGSVK